MVFDYLGARLTVRPFFCPLTLHPAGRRGPWPDAGASPNKPFGLITPSNRCPFQCYNECLRRGLKKASQGMSRFTKLAVISLSVLVFCYVAIGYVLGQAASQQRPYRSLTVFTEVLQHIQNDYVEEPDIPAVTVGALHGLLEALDPQSSYLSPQEFVEYKRRLSNPPRGDIGVTLSKRFGYVAVASVLPEGPAGRAGVRPGDIFENIRGFSTREMSVAQARLLLAGDVDTSVRVAALRSGQAEPKEIDMVRAAPVTPRLTLEKLTVNADGADAAVAYLRVPSFDAGRAEELRARLWQWEKQGLRRLVLDLRDCAAGDPAEGIAAAQLFLEKGTITTLKGQTIEKQVFSADAARLAWKYPLAVLMSNGTAGPAEVLAAALADNGRARTIGERTFGTASVQRTIPLEDGAAVILTVANYYTPNGKAIPTEGVTPNLAMDDRSAEPGEKTALPVREDPLVKKALEILASPAQPLGKTAFRVSPAPRSLREAA